MSGSPATTKPPADDAEWARDTERRIAAVETPSSTRVGPWVLSANDAGDLIASYSSGGGGVVLARRPANVTDPDDLTGLELARIKAVAQTQTVNTAGDSVAVVWSGTEYAEGDWAPIENATDVVVPESGVYLLTLVLNSVQRSSTVTKAIVVLNDEVLIAEEVDAADEQYYRNHGIVSTYQLTKGDVVRVLGYSDRQQGWGTSPVDPLNTSSLSLVRLV